MVEMTRDPSSSRTTIRVTEVLDEALLRELPEKSLITAYERIVEKVVSKIVEEKFGEILSKVDTLAIANLSIARCADKIANELMKQNQSK